MAFLENAGGAQAPASVIEAIRAYMHACYVQPGAGYRESNLASGIVDDAHRFMELFVNAGTAGRAIMGPSSSALLRMLGECWRPMIRPGDEIVVAEAGHEANIAPWVALESSGAIIRWWRCQGAANGAPLDALDTLLSRRTRLVCVHHVSNLLGGVVDIAEVARRAKAVGARTIVDGVAFAPHRAIDVSAWGCDWYVFSNYKVFGPHMATLFGRHEAIGELTGPGHFFIPKSTVPAKFELGGVPHESCAGVLGLRPYLAFLAGSTGARPAPPKAAAPSDWADTLSTMTSPVLDRPTIERAMQATMDLEAPLTERLMSGLESMAGIEIVGPSGAGRERVPTVSLRHSQQRSSEVVAKVHALGVAIRNGHMYSHRLCEALGIDPSEGVIRISAVHYNTEAEIDRTLEAIQRSIS